MHWQRSQLCERERQTYNCCLHQFFVFRTKLKWSLVWKWRRVWTMFWPLERRVERCSFSSFHPFCQAGPTGSVWKWQVLEVNLLESSRQTSLPISVVLSFFLYSYSLSSSFFVSDAALLLDRCAFYKSDVRWVESEHAKVVQWWHWRFCSMYRDGLCTGKSKKENFKWDWSRCCSPSSLITIKREMSFLGTVWSCQTDVFFLHTATEQVLHRGGRASRNSAAGLSSQNTADLDTVQEYPLHAWSWESQDRQTW